MSEVDYARAEKTSPERESQTDRLRGELEELHAAVSRLEARLQPVLRNVGQDRQHPAPALLAEVGQSQLADRVGDVVNARYRILTILEELDL